MPSYLDSHNVKNGKGGRFARKRKSGGVAKALGAGLAIGAATEGVAQVGRNAGLPRHEAFAGGAKIIASRIVHKVGRGVDRLLPR